MPGTDAAYQLTAKDQLLEAVDALAPDSKCQSHCKAATITVCTLCRSSRQPKVGDGSRRSRQRFCTYAKGADGPDAQARETCL